MVLGNMFEETEYQRPRNEFSELIARFAGVLDGAFCGAEAGDLSNRSCKSNAEPPVA